MQTKSVTSFETPLFSVDSVLFTIIENELKVLLVKRAIEPFKEYWGLPGGYVDTLIDKTTDETAIRKLKEKTGVVPPYLEQLSSFSGPSRDPRGYTVTLVYYALVAGQDVCSNIDTVDSVKWVAVNELSDISIAFDHLDIIKQALQRIRQKSLYSMLPVYCLARQFTIAQLKAAIEVIVGKSIQRKSLIRRIEACGMFESLDQKVASGGRFAQVYQLKEGVDLVSFERNLSQ